MSTNEFWTLCRFNADTPSAWLDQHQPFKPSRCIKESFYMPENRLNLLQRGVLERKFPWSLRTNTWEFSLIFKPRWNHLHPLQVENCDSNSRLVVGEDDNGKFRLERVLSQYCVKTNHTLIYYPHIRMVLHDTFLTILWNLTTALSWQTRCVTSWPIRIPSKHETYTQCWFNAGPPSSTLGKRLVFAGLLSPYIFKVKRGNLCDR